MIEEVAVGGEDKTQLSRTRAALFAAMDHVEALADALEGWVTQLRERGWTEDQARAIVASNFGWKPRDES